MPEYVFPPTVIAVPTTDGGLFPVRRVYCVGRNYAEHAREMGHDPNEAPPFFFGKPADALVTGNGDMPYPSETADLHHELVAFDAELAQRMSDRAVRLLRATDAGELLPRVAATRDFLDCRFCPWAERCWRLRA